MDELQKFHLEWQERCRCIQRDTPLYTSLVVFVFILSGIAIFFSYLEYGLFGLICMTLIIAACILYILRKLSIHTSEKYQDVLYNYLMLVSAINENISEAFDKNYHKIFWEYENFIGIRFDMNEFDIVKKFRSFPGNKRQYTKADFEEMARNHVKTRALLEEEKVQRQAKRFQKIM